MPLEIVNSKKTKAYTYALYYASYKGENKSFGIKTGLVSDIPSKICKSKQVSSAIWGLSFLLCQMMVLIPTSQVWWALEDNAHTGLRVSSPKREVIITLLL